MSAFEWTDTAVRAALGSRGPARPDLEYTGVSIDSRAIRPGNLFVALVGDRFDGHAFVADAVSRGARGAIVSRPVEDAQATQIYRVGDTLVALGALAAWRRRSIESPVVGITGSAGKTTTKEFTRAALSGALRVHATAGNLNNRVGVPLTLLAVPADAEAVVLELGTNEPGEMAALASISRPDVGVVTMVGESHLEKLGSVEGVLDEKLSLLRGLADGGRCIVGDQPEALVREARRACSDVRVAGWSERADVDLRPESAEADAEGAYRFRWRGQPVALEVPGRHAVTNALLSLAVAELLGVAPADAVRGLASVRPGSLRGERRRIGGLTIVVDCYNANPPSVRVALDLLEAQRATRRVAVLGTMLELGDATGRLHREVLRDALSRNVDLIVATGAFEQAARELAADVRLLLAPDWRRAYPVLKQRLGGDEVVLLKASRGIGMEGILPLLEADFGSPAGREA